jgi:hypothetical protein
LQLRDPKFQDVGSELVLEYARRIAEAKKLLTPEKLQAFLASGSAPDLEVKFHPC